MSIRSLAGEPCIVVTDMERPVFEGKRTWKVTKLADYTYEIDLRAGEEVIIHPAGTRPKLVIAPVENAQTNCFGKKNPRK